MRTNKEWIVFSAFCIGLAGWIGWSFDTIEARRRAENYGKIQCSTDLECCELNGDCDKDIFDFVVCDISNPMDCESIND